MDTLSSRLVSRLRKPGTPLIAETDTHRPRIVFDIMLCAGVSHGGTLLFPGSYYRGILSYSAHVPLYHLPHRKTTCTRSLSSAWSISRIFKPMNTVSQIHAVKKHLELTTASFANAAIYDCRSAGTRCGSAECGEQLPANWRPRLVLNHGVCQIYSTIFFLCSDSHSGVTMAVATVAGACASCHANDS